MKKKELKKLVRELTQQNAELRLTRYTHIQDIRDLLSGNRADRFKIKLKYNMLNKFDQLVWQGDKGVGSDGFFTEIKSE
jgi:hypothetical protein